MTPRFFASAAGFRRWLERHAATTPELWVGFHKKGSGRRGMTYAEAVEEALCFGWIDGILRRVDDTSYTHRFTPRRPRSHWSALNIARVHALEAAGRMTDAGRSAFAGHGERQAPDAHEAGPRDLNPAQQRVVQAHPEAWAFHSTQAPAYRKAVALWIASAKRDTTRERRLTQLIECAARGERIPQFLSPPAPKR